jgi:acyl-CoA synthetase (AMP-forming)/AMP-acid ligase II
MLIDTPAVMISHGNINCSIGQGIVTSTAQAEVHPVCYTYQSQLLLLQLNLLPFRQPADGIPVILALLPMHHTYGLNIYAFRSCLIRSTLVLMPKWDTKVALRAIPKYAYYMDRTNLN